MNDKKMVVDTQLEMFPYLRAVNDIAIEYFNVDGVYQPHVGVINAMRIFYNLCVKESKFDEEYSHDIYEATDMEKIVLDKEFITEFNNAIWNTTGIGFTFGNAYQQALDIVECKKNSFENTITMLSKAITDIIDQFSTAMNEETIDKIVDVANKISDNKITADTIVEAYSQSQQSKKNIEK